MQSICWESSGIFQIFKLIKKYFLDSPNFLTAYLYLLLLFSVVIFWFMVYQVISKVFGELFHISNIEPRVIMKSNFTYFCAFLFLVSYYDYIGFDCVTLHISVKNYWLIVKDGTCSVAVIGSGWCSQTFFVSIS